MLEHNGKMYARVTEVLTKESNLDGIDPDVLKNKARIGTNVHEAIKDFINGEFPVLLPDEINYFLSFKNWFKILNPNVIEIEQRYYDHQKMFTGCIDALFKIQGKHETILVDYKTSAQANIPYWSKQAHLYAHLLNKSNKPVAETFLYIQLDKYGDLPHVRKIKYDVNIHNKCLKMVDEFWLTSNLVAKNYQN